MICFMALYFRFLNHELDLPIILYLCRNLVSRKTRLKGNPVRIRYRPAAVSSKQKIFDNYIHCFINGKDFKNGVSQKTCQKINV